MKEQSNKPMFFEEWLKIITVEKLDELKNNVNFKFCNQSLYKEFSVSQKMLKKILDYYKYDVPKLTKNKKMSTIEWVERIINKRGNEYDYSLVEYKNSATKVKIICKKHGVFEQTPNSHYSRLDNCPKCGKENTGNLLRTTLEDFIKESNKKHRGKFDYSLVHNFKTVEEKVKIICPKHGIFEQRAISHKAGYDCEKCSYEKRGVDYSISKEDMLERFKSLKSFLEYDLTDYRNINSIITYNCPAHGTVKQTAAKHLRGGAKCSKCQKKNVWNTKTTEQFKVAAYKVHKGYYSYDKSIYVNNYTPVIITCKFHGDFKQRPNNHVDSSAGCPVCAKIASNMREYKDIEEAKFIDCSLYIIEMSCPNQKEKFYKIGVSRFVDERIKGITSDSGYYYKINVLQKYETNLFNAYSLEQHLHKKYKKSQYYPLTYFQGHTECFNIDLSIEDVKKHITENFNTFFLHN